MVPRLGPGETQDRRREEHGLIVRVGDQQADALVGQAREAHLHGRGRVRVQGRYEEEQAGDIEEAGHGCSASRERAPTGGRFGL